MLFCSPHERDVTLKETLFRGFASDGELYLPQDLPTISVETLRGLSFLEVSRKVGQNLFPELDPSIYESAFNFPLSLNQLGDGTYILELFHGPTLSFKDFGARFMAQVVRCIKEPNEPLTILVATSGDTGSAVGNAFLGMKNIRVYILYPKGSVTPAQEKQLTTIGDNVTAVEVDGGFEECQRLLKEACLDPTLPNTTTANSINCIRLLGHLFYYFYAAAQFDEPPLFSVPCGNFGHLVAGLLAKRMGLPVKQFIGATNINDEVPAFLKSGIFQSHPAYHTLSVSMDVGDPSNFPRLLQLYNSSLEALRADLIGFSFTDGETAAAIRTVDQKCGYLLDPHSAIGYLGLKKYQETDTSASPAIFFATAHPSKFAESLEPIVVHAIPSHPSLQTSCPKEALSCSSHYQDFKKLL